MGGGIGDGLGQVPIEEDKYIVRVIYDLAFFVIVIIILLNIVFGIIIDTFADLREKKKEKERLLNSVCFIWGIDRS